jgi:hypothetical protein
LLDARACASDPDAACGVRSIRRERRARRFR